MQRESLVRAVTDFFRRATRPSERPEEDTRLLDRFAATGDPGAFAVLVDRYGGMVLHVCQRVLGDPHAAEDAFQATFLVLARKAGSIGRHASLASWLWQVAYRAALRSRRRSTRLATQPLPEGGLPGDPTQDPAERVDQQELSRLLVDEIQKLPEKYRVPLILCSIEGRDYNEAAEKLGRPRGTLSAQVTRAKEMIRRRLERRGWVLPAAAVAMCLESSAQAQAPLRLVPEVLKLVAEQRGSSGGAAETIVSLAEGVMSEMSITKLKWACAILCVVSVTGLWGLTELQSQPTVQYGAFAPPTPSADTRTPAFTGKALRVEAKNLMQKNNPVILLDPAVRTLGNRTFIVGQTPKQGKLWIPVEDVTSIGEYADLEDLRKYWKVE